MGRTGSKRFAQPEVRMYIHLATNEGVGSSNLSGRANNRIANHAAGDSNLFGYANLPKFDQALSISNFSWLTSEAM
jgi:hypothetical protein